MRVSAAVSFLALASCLSPPLAAQATPPDLTGSGYAFGETYSVEMVLVPVAVRGGPPGERLGRDRFALAVDGRKVAIESFEDDAKAPLSLIYLQDLSGSMAEPGKMETSREVLGCLLDNARKEDEISVSSFSGDRTQVEVPLTYDVAPAREAMGLWEPWGTTGLYDAIAMLPEISLGSAGVKRAAILVTDGIDNASAMTPDEAQSVVQHSALPVYVLALPGRPEGDETVAPAPAAEATPFSYAELLRQIADATGGRYYTLAEPIEGKRTCSAILAELRRQYVLGFSVTGSGPSTFHPIRVDVRDLDDRATLVHRRGYRGTVPQSATGG